MNKIRISFDIGHGKNTYPPSKGIGNFAEWEFNNAVVKYAIPLAEYNNFEVLLTQPLDSDVVNLTQRINNINAEHKKNPIKLLMSFHADFNENLNAKGHWCFYWHTSTNGKKLATIWMKYADEILPNPSRGLMQSKPNEWTNFAINRDTDMPTALMEHAFYSSSDDLKLLKSDDFRKQCAIVAVKTICEYCGVEYKEMKTEVKQETKQGKILVNLNIRQFNTTSSAIIGKLNKNDIVTILSEKDGWYRIDKGWIFENSGKYVEIITEKPKEEIKVDNNLPKEYMYKDCKVVEVNPLDLKIIVADKPANKVSARNMCTSIFQTWEAIFENGKKTDKLKSVPLGILVDGGKIISNRQPHVGFGNIKYPAGTLIVHNDGKVEVKSITDINNEKDVKFVTSGVSILPKILMKEEGFSRRRSIDGKVRDFSDVGRTTSRICVGFNSKKNKIIIVGMISANIGKAQLIMKELGCDCAISCDAGGSAILVVNGKPFMNTSRQLYGFISW
jgi:N-acetylmuramoyl-L-alanine amidase